MDSPGGVWGKGGGERSGGEMVGEEGDAREKKPVPVREKTDGEGGQASLEEVLSLPNE